MNSIVLADYDHCLTSLTSAVLFSICCHFRRLSDKMGNNGRMIYVMGLLIDGCLFRSLIVACLNMQKSEGKRVRDLLSYFTASKRSRDDTTHLDSNTPAATVSSTAGNAGEVSSHNDTGMSSADLSCITDADTNTPSIIGRFPGDLSKSKFDRPAQPHRDTYPQSGTNRSFQYCWFAQHPWLEYSIERDAAFCYTCRHFSGADSMAHKYRRDAVSFFLKVFAVYSFLI